MKTAKGDDLKVVDLRIFDLVVDDREAVASLNHEARAEVVEYLADGFERGFWREGASSWEGEVLEAVGGRIIEHAFPKKS